MTSSIFVLLRVLEYLISFSHFDISAQNNMNRLFFSIFFKCCLVFTPGEKKALLAKIFTGLLWRRQKEERMLSEENITGLMTSFIFYLLFLSKVYSINYTLFHELFWVEGYLAIRIRKRFSSLIKNLDIKAFRFFVISCLFETLGRE